MRSAVQQKTRAMHLSLTLSAQHRTITSPNVGADFTLDPPEGYGSGIKLIFEQLRSQHSRGPGQMETNGNWKAIAVDDVRFRFVTSSASRTSGTE